jgi:hypothetical protein
MVDAAPWRVAENCIRSIAGGHIQDPVSLCEETMFKIYPALQEAEEREREQENPEIQAGTPYPSNENQKNVERVRDHKASRPHEIGETKSGGSMIHSQQGGD